MRGAGEGERRSQCVRTCVGRQRVQRITGQSEQHFTVGLLLVQELHLRLQRCALCGPLRLQRLQQLGGGGGGVLRGGQLGARAL